MPYHDRKSTRLNSSHGSISYAVFCLKKKKKRNNYSHRRLQSAVVCTNQVNSQSHMTVLWISRRPSFALAYVVTVLFFFFFFNDTATTEIYTLSLHDALPICSFFFAGYIASVSAWTAL